MTHVRRAVSALSLALSLSALPSAARADVDLWPLLELSDDTTTVMYPFYVHEGDFMMVFPVYYRTDDGHEHHVLWPIFKMKDGRVSRVAPFWFSDDPDKFWIFPLAYHDADRTFLLVPPAYFHGDEFQAVVPFYLHSHDRDRDWLWIGPRLFGWEKTSTQDDYFGGVLFDWGKHTNGYWHTSVFPVTWLWGGPDERGFVFLPAFWVRAYHQSIDALLPLYWSSHENGESYFWLMGYWKSHTNTSDSLAFYPFFSHEKKGSDTNELSILWPLYEREETVSSAGTLLHRHRRFLAFSDDERSGHRELSLFGFVVRESTD